MPLTLKQHRFVTEYLVDLNASQAALRAGYSARTAPQQGSRLSKNVEVQAAIATQQAQQLEAVEVRIEDVLRDLKAITYTDLRKHLVASRTPALISTRELHRSQFRRWGSPTGTLFLLLPLLGVAGHDPG